MQTSLASPREASPSGCSGQPTLCSWSDRMPQNESFKGNLGSAEPRRDVWPWSKPAKKVSPGLASLRWSHGPLGGTVPVGFHGNGSQLLPKSETKLYRRRWLMLFLFAAVSASNASMWLQYGIICNIFTSFYDVDSSAIDWLSTIYLLTYVPLVLPVLWLLDTRGIREVVLVGSALNCIGAWVKMGSAHPDMFPVAFWGQFLCSVATVFVLGIPSYLASMWFGEQEVSTACSIGVLGNQVCLFARVLSLVHHAGLRWMPESHETCSVLV